MKHHLFYTFLGIFLATSIVTLLGVTGVIEVQDFYLRVLVFAFLVELAGAVIFIFKGARFFDEHEAVKPDALVMESIRKLDNGIGILDQRINENYLRIKVNLLHLTDTPRTDILELVIYIQKHRNDIRPGILNLALGAIAGALEKGVKIGQTEKANLHSLVKSLPDAIEGNRVRILACLDNPDGRQ